MTVVDAGHAPATRTDRKTSRHVALPIATIAEFVLYLAVALVIIWPVTPHLLTRSVGSGDAEAYVWMSWRVGELLKDFTLLPTELPDAVWPYGSSLLSSDGYLPVYVGGLWNVVLPPVLAFNCAVLTALMLNLAAGRALARRFSRKRFVWIVTAIAFTTAPSIEGRLSGHYTFVWAFTLPLIVAAAIDVGRDHYPVRPVRLAALLFLAYLCSIFSLLFGALAYLVIVGWSRPRAWRQWLPRLAAACAIALLLMTPFVLERLRLDRDERAAGARTVLTEEATAFGADLESIVVPPYTSTFNPSLFDAAQRSFGDNVVEATIFPGYLLLLAFGGLFVLRSRLRTPLILAAGAVWLMALGPSLKVHGNVLLVDEAGRSVRWLPFTALQSLPGLGMMRTPNRASFALAAVLAAALALGLDWLVGRARTTASRFALVAACALLLMSNLVIPINWAKTSPGPAVSDALDVMRTEAGDGDTMTFVPADCFDDINNNGILQIEFRIPMLGCQANFASIPWYSGFEEYVDSRPLAGLRCDAGFLGKRLVPHPGDTIIDEEGFEELHEALGVRFYIVDKVVARAKEICAPRIDAIVGAVEDHAMLLGEDERWAVYDAFPRGRASSAR